MGMNYLGVLAGPKVGTKPMIKGWNVELIPRANDIVMLIKQKQAGKGGMWRAFVLLNTLHCQEGLMLQSI